MFIYHATPLENLFHILEHGLATNHQKVWDCSRNDCLYFWAYPESPEYVESDLIRQQQCLDYAIQNGQIAAAVHESQHKKLGILVYDFNSEELDEYADTSCYNMDGSLEIPICDIDLSKLRYFITSEDVYEPKLSPFYLTSLSLPTNITPSMQEVIQLLQPLQTESVYLHCIEMGYNQALSDLIPMQPNTSQVSKLSIPQEVAILS